MTDVVVGVDIGTTSTKAVAYSVDGTAHARHSVAYPLDSPQPGYAVQDPDLILAAVRTCIGLASSGHRVAALSFSSAMHSLIGLDAAGRPLTPLITWADRRAAPQADRLRAVPGARSLYARTGTPIHAMSPLAKLMWFRETDPGLAARVAHWVGVKDYVLHRLTGRLVVDHSVAGGTGLQDLDPLRWDDEALGLAVITADRLPEPVSSSTLLPAPGLPGPVVVGAADGPLANLGCGAVGEGVAACSIGTSGAFRVLVDTPATDPAGGVFCYPLTSDRWTIGGATNGGGIVLEWAHHALAPDLATLEDVLAVAAQAPAGSDGLLMAPYLLGERAPWWSSDAQGGYAGLRLSHGRPHLIRAALEGTCHQLALVADAVRAAGHRVDSVRATGGFARSPLWRQMLADCLDMPVGFPDGYEGSCFGAALLGMQALALIGSLDVAATLVPVGLSVQPDPRAAEVYRAARASYASWGASFAGSEATRS